MKFYTYQYKVNANQEAAFKYFLQKEYLIKYFSVEEKVEIISENSADEVAEGEEIKLLFEDENQKISLKLIVAEINNQKLINYHLYFDSIEELQAEEDSDDEDFGSFINKYIGQKIEYKIYFRRHKDFLIIDEESEVFVNNFWSKIFWKLLGIYYRFKQRKTHQQVKVELQR